MLSKFFKPKAAQSALDSDMSIPADDPMQMIGRAALEAAHDADGKVLLYAEVLDGVVSADIFSRRDGEKVRFRFAPSSLKSAIYEFWEAEVDSAKRWSTMSVIIDSGRFYTSFEYSESLVPGEELHDRRPRVVRAHFGDASVDYSSPK
jgi:hypothetical protein